MRVCVCVRVCEWCASGCEVGGGVLVVGLVVGLVVWSRLCSWCLCDCVIAWLYGCVCGCAVVRLCGYVYSCMVVWLCGMHVLHIAKARCCSVLIGGSLL